MKTFLYLFILIRLINGLKSMHVTFQEFFLLGTTMNASHVGLWPWILSRLLDMCVTVPIYEQYHHLATFLSLRESKPLYKIKFTPLVICMVTLFIDKANEKPVFKSSGKNDKIKVKSILKKSICIKTLQMHV